MVGSDPVNALTPPTDAGADEAPQRLTYLKSHPALLL